MDKTMFHRYVCPQTALRTLCCFITRVDDVPTPRLAPEYTAERPFYFEQGLTAELKGTGARPML